jgi:hypothetical protein
MESMQNRNETGCEHPLDMNTSLFLCEVPVSWSKNSNPNVNTADSVLELIKTAKPKGWWFDNWGASFVINR